MHGERRQPPYLWSEDSYHNSQWHRSPWKSTASILQQSTTLAFHPFKEFTGLVWPFCATFHSRTPAKMFSRADQRFLLLSLGWYNLTAAWHQGQLETGNSYVTALQIELKLYMSPDQVTRASSKSSSVSPGDSLGETTYWWKEIMYHRQKEEEKNKNAPHNTSLCSPSAAWASCCPVARGERGIKFRGRWCECSR